MPSIPRICEHLVPELVPGHLGALHPVEQVLVLVVAFGPFAVLAVVIGCARRRDARIEQEQEELRRSAR